MRSHPPTHPIPSPPCSKAFFIQYKTGLRVIVLTGNLTYPDGNNKTELRCACCAWHLRYIDAAVVVGSKHSRAPCLMVAGELCV